MFFQSALHLPKWGVGTLITYLAHMPCLHTTDLIYLCFALSSTFCSAQRTKYIYVRDNDNSRNSKKIMAVNLEDVTRLFAKNRNENFECKILALTSFTRLFSKFLPTSSSDSDFHLLQNVQPGNRRLLSTKKVLTRKIWKWMRKTEKNMEIKWNNEDAGGGDESRKRREMHLFTKWISFEGVIPFESKGEKSGK